MAILTYTMVTLDFVLHLNSPPEMVDFPDTCNKDQFDKFKVLHPKQITFCTITNFDMCESYKSYWNRTNDKNDYE